MIVSINEILSPVKNELNEFNKRLRKSMLSDVALVNLIAKYLVRTKGKQVRPMLVLLAAEACGGITEIPISWAREDTARFKLTGLADRWPPTGPDQVLAEWIFDYEATVERGGLFVLTLHDWIAGRPAQLRVLETLLSRIYADEATWLATGADIADHHCRAADAHSRDLRSGLGVS